MKKKLYMLLAACGVMALAASTAAWAQGSQLVDKAQSEGKVVIYSTTDLPFAKPLIDAFEKKYPGINVSYLGLGSSTIYSKVVAEGAAGQVTADVVWSSAMDLQVKLAKDGYLRQVDIPQAQDFPEWAVYKNRLYATSVAPIGMIYNTKLIPKDKVPHSHAELIEFMKSDLGQKGVATYDPTKSGTGFLIDTNALRTLPNFWELAKAFGTAKGRTYASSGAMKETVLSGQNVLAFNLFGSYGLIWAQNNPDLGVAFTKDQTAAVLRSAGVTKDAPHPAAGKLFLQFMLSKAGQSELANKGLPSIRTDVETGLNLKTLNELVGGNLQPIKLNEDLLEYMDPMKRREFFQKWRKATG